MLYFKNFEGEGNGVIVSYSLKPLKCTESPFHSIRYMQLFTNICSCSGAVLSRLFVSVSPPAVTKPLKTWVVFFTVSWWSCLSEHKLDFVLCSEAEGRNPWTRRDLWRSRGTGQKWSDHSFLSNITAIQGMGSLSFFFFFNLIKILANLKSYWIFILIKTWGKT